MGKLSILIFLILLAVLALFAIDNTGVTEIKVPFDGVYNPPTIALLLLSSAIGFFVTLIFFAIRDTKRFIENWQFQKKQKQDIKVQELYSKALNSLLAFNKDEAKDALEGILVEEPGHINALLRLGDISTSENDYRGANDYYRKARDLNSQNIDTLFAIEKLMEKTERWSDALKYLEEILDIAEYNQTAMYRKRNILEKQGRWDDLIYLQKTILKHERAEKDRKRENQNLIGYKYEYGRYSLENNQLEKAKKAFKTVLRLDKDFIPATLGIAEVMLREGNSEEAVNLLEKTYDNTFSKIVLARLEDILISLGEPARLIGIYKNGISKNPEDWETKYFLGKLFFRLEMIDDAFETLTSIDTGGALNPQLYQLLGHLYMRRNQPERAVEEFKKVVDYKWSLRFPYCCNNCGYESKEWAGRCPDCKQWGSYRFNLNGPCRT